MALEYRPEIVPVVRKPTASWVWTLSVDMPIALVPGIRADYTRYGRRVSPTNHYPDRALH
jgi:hypothetical protein